VLQVVLSLHPGGTERLLIELATRLHEQIPMAVCCLDERGAWASELEDRGIHVTALGRTPGFHPTLGRRVAAAAREHGATVIHAHHYSPFVYSAIARLWGSRCPVIYTEHGRLSDAGPSRKRRWVNRLLFARTPGRTFTVSEDVKRHIVAEGFKEEQVGVIYNGIEIGPLPSPEDRARSREELGVDDRAFVVGTVARLDPVKDLGTLLRALGGLKVRGSSELSVVSRESNTRITASRILLLIIGDGEERAGLEALATELGVGESVRFMGYRSDARAWLAGCDAYVNCSVSEGVSLTILEAMAAGLPVIATRVGGTPEVIDETCGRLVPPRDPDAIAEALSALVENPDLRVHSARRGRERVERQFSIEAMVSAYSKVYRSVNV
jgi:glycosyltransferase involved in cell wall biosynthesis